MQPKRRPDAGVRDGASQRETASYNKSGAANEHDAALLSNVAHLIRPCLLRRLKTDV